MGPSINYVISKLAIFDPLPPSLSSLYCIKSAIFYPHPPLVRRHSLWTAPILICNCKITIFTSLIKSDTYDQKLHFINNEFRFPKGP